jgi:hypothetical protein
MTDGDNVVPLRFSRMNYSRQESLQDLGPTELTRMAGKGLSGTHGHWCGRCKGIWYSAFGEVECPVCRNRHG